MARTRSSAGGGSSSAAARPRVSPPRRRPIEQPAAASNYEADEAAAASPGEACVICLTATGRARATCGHRVCSECFRSYVEFRIDQRKVLDMSCPGANDCQALVSREEVAAIVEPAHLARYDAFLSAERAERDPHTRWCVRPGCGSICMPCSSEERFSRTAVVLGLGATACAAATCIPHLAPSLGLTLGLSREILAATLATGTAGLFLGLWHGTRRLSPRRRCICPTCGDSVCYDCKAAWHPGSMCEEVVAQEIVRWCRARDAGQCPQCGLFIVRARSHPRTRRPSSHLLSSARKQCLWAGPSFSLLTPPLSPRPLSLLSAPRLPCISGAPCGMQPHGLPVRALVLLALPAAAQRALRLPAVWRPAHCRGQGSSLFSRVATCRPSLVGGRLAAPPRLWPDRGRRAPPLVRRRHAR